MAVADAPRALTATRAALAAEWAATAPATAEDVAAFYRHSRQLAADLRAWHRTPERQAWTQALCRLVQRQTAHQGRPLTVVDIGAGGGHDLAAVAARCPTARLHGVEPNDALRAALPCAATATVDAAPLETADVLVCIDVLEHVPDPEAFLGSIAARAPVGALLVEATATQDCSTPLHLAANRGWHPGRVLDRHGWACVDATQGRLRVWERQRLAAPERTGLLLCAYRAVSAATVRSLLALTCRPEGSRWAIRIKDGDALIGRSRSIIASQWWRETAADVFLMVDDDLVFTPEAAEHLVALCRDGHDVICGAYPVHNGAHLALRRQPGMLSFGPEESPTEVEYPATGFMAVHRRVLDALIPTLPLCHASQAWSFWPLFDTAVVPDEAAGGHALLSEDWGFGRLARQAGFKIWLDPTLLLSHLSQIEVGVVNMGHVQAAIQALGPGATDG